MGGLVSIVSYILKSLSVYCRKDLTHDLFQYLSRLSQFLSDRVLSSRGEARRGQARPPPHHQLRSPGGRRRPPPGSSS